MDTTENDTTENGQNQDWTSLRTGLTEKSHYRECQKVGEVDGTA